MTNLAAMYRGNTKQITVTISDTNGVVDITGDTCVLTCKNDPYNTLAETALTITNADPHSDPTNGVTVFEITDAQSKLFALGLMHYDVTWNRASPAAKYTVLAGTFDVQEPVLDPV